MLSRYLDDIEQRIDPAMEERLYAGWSDFARGRFSGELFTPKRPHAIPSALAWPEIRTNAAIEDPDAMVLRQFRTCSDMLAGASGHLLCVRADYGTGIIPSLFGARLFMMDDALDTLPTVWPMGGADAARTLLDGGVPDLHGGLGGKVFAMGERLRAIAAEYPRIGRHVHVYHPDTQGPLDVCEMLWGSSIFEAFYLEPDLVTDLLNLITETYIAFLREWFSLLPPSDTVSPHWGMMHGGTIMIRNDSAMNLSPELYRQFAQPFDARCLEAFGGGAIHFCGRGDHYIAAMSTTPGLQAINLSQPELNDMETIFRNTVDKHIPLIGLAPAAARAAMEAGRDLHGKVHAG